MYYFGTSTVIVLYAYTVLLGPNPSSVVVLDVHRNKLLKKMVPGASPNEVKHRNQSQGNVGTPLVPSSRQSQAERLMDDVDPEKDADSIPDEDEKATTYGDVIRIGLLTMDRDNGWKWFKIVALIAFVVDLIDVTWIFFLPCLHDFYPQVCQ